MNFDREPFERASTIYPQPIALTCGRVCRARTPQERLDAILKCAEVLTRYLCALAVSSFDAREDAAVPVPPAMQDFDGNLSFGTFLSVVQAVAGVNCKHPLLYGFSAAFRGKRGVRGPADESLTALLELRNDLGHELMAISEAKAAAVFADKQPDVLLVQAIQALGGLLSLPLFLVEEQRSLQKRIVARRLLLMGESADPLPESVQLSDSLMYDRFLYVGVKGGALNLHPLLVWDVAYARATYGIFFPHSVSERDVEYVTANDDGQKDESLYSKLMERLAGRLSPVEAVTLTGGTDFAAEWRDRRDAIVRREDGSDVPWDDMDPSTIRWYGLQLAATDDDGTRQVIRDRLLDGRERLAPEELGQFVLLFGREDVVRRVLRRDLIDCRARSSTDKRWDERVESAQNVMQSLKLAIDFFGRHVGVDGATLDGLRATSGSADYIAMREALVNLFIHQDYGDASTVSQVETSPNRAVFFNPGRSLADPTALVEGGRSQSRNPLISRALRLIGFAELAGSGLRELHLAWRGARRRPPIIMSPPDGNIFTLILDWRNMPDTSVVFWRDRLGVKLSRQEAQVLVLSADPAGVSVEQIASAEGLYLDDAGRLAEKLVKEGLVHKLDGNFHIMEHLAELAAEAQQQVP